MRKYNYFDDEPDVEERSLIEKITDKIDLYKIKRNVVSTVEDVIHGDAIEELKELPNLKKALLKILAAVISLIIIVCFILIFSHSVNSQNRSNEQFCKDAGKVCTNYITEYGPIKWETLDSEKYGKNKARLTGLCYARQMDFDNNGSDELMVCYNDKNVYYLEVWGYDGKDFVKFYSQEANTTNDEIYGSWVGFYHKGNKYYICKSQTDTPEKVSLYTLKGTEFKKSSECDYDYKDDIYSVKGKINAQDFETIKLSAVRTSKAEQIIDIVTENLETFGSISVAAIESQKTDEQLKAEAYYAVVEKRNEKYGKAEVVTKYGSSYIDGVCIVKLIDFNGDGNEELFIVYRKILKKSGTNSYTGEYIMMEEPTYCMEVYNWNGTVAKRIFSKDEISRYMSDEEVNYVMLKTGEQTTHICHNTYSFETQFSYTASSKIYKMKGESFTTSFNARVENNYGYRQYYIDNEYVYSSQFENEGYKVPLFLDDDGTFDSSKYSVTYLSGKDQENFDAVVDETVQVIQTLNKNYSPADE